MREGGGGRRKARGREGNWREEGWVWMEKGEETSGIGRGYFAQKDILINGVQMICEGKTRQLLLSILLYNPLKQRL